MVVTVINVDAYLFLAFSDVTYHLENKRIDVFQPVSLCHLVVRRLNLEVATTRLKIPGQFQIHVAHGSMSPQLCWGYSQSPRVSFVTTDQFSVRIIKITQVSQELTAYLSDFHLFKLNKVTKLAKIRKPDNFDHKIC